MTFRWIAESSSQPHPKGKDVVRRSVARDVARHALAGSRLDPTGEPVAGIARGKAACESPRRADDGDHGQGGENLAAAERRQCSTECPATPHERLLPQSPRFEELQVRPPRPEFPDVDGGQLERRGDDLDMARSGRCAEEPG